MAPENSGSCTSRSSSSIDLLTSTTLGDLHVNKQVRLMDVSNSTLVSLADLGGA